MDNDMGGKSWHQPPPRDNRNNIQTRPYFFYPVNPRLPTRAHQIMLAIYHLQIDTPTFLPPPHPLIPQTDTERRTSADTSDLYADHDHNVTRSTTGSPVASTSRMMSADVAPPVTHTLTSGEAADIKPSKQPCKDKVDASIPTLLSSYFEIHGQSVFQAVTDDASPAGPHCLHVPVEAQAKAAPFVQGIVDAQAQTAAHRAATHAAARRAAHHHASQAEAYHAAHHIATQAAAHYAAQHAANQPAANHAAHHAATQAAAYHAATQAYHAAHHAFNEARAHYAATQAAAHEAAAKAHAHYAAQLGLAQAHTQIPKTQGVVPGTFLTSVPPPNCPACCNVAGYAPAPPAFQTQPATQVRSDPTPPERAVFQPLPVLKALHSVPEPARRTRSTANAFAAHPASSTPTAFPIFPSSIPPRPVFRPPPPPPTTRQNVTYSQDPRFVSSRADNLPAPSRVDNIPVVSANRNIKIAKTVTTDGSRTRNNKPASRSARPSAPINFAPPPVTTAATANPNRPRYYSEVARGGPRRNQAQVAPETGTNIPTVLALSNNPWPNRNMLIPRGSASSKVNTTKSNRFGAVGDGRPKKTIKEASKYNNKSSGAGARATKGLGLLH